MRKLIFGFFFFISFHAMAQLKSPAGFLGYELGSRYTSHASIVAYFKYVAGTMPANVKLQPYGTTNENRELFTVAVSSAQNMANLEQIRQQNVQRANAVTVNNASNTAIVWLSYNVHGNEPSSSEAAMLTLYALASESITDTKPWLQNTVVIIDPCLNPDGRERYVNWYTSVAGKTPDADVHSREHNEPWPGGRVNHYNFDLNRDWAWQTQKESRARVVAYQQWMPQVHVDFHEQGINSPYYFAPAAEPYSDVITKFQRDFQKTIGANHARYFDKKGWLFFTNEIFDLFYPSYGDTYPLFNGSIGMTYEQAGGPAGGILATMHDGDTLTLANRILHHYTTGLSTVETASAHAADLVNAFTNYFKDAASGTGNTYQSYVLKADAYNKQQIQQLLQLLDKNKISYGKGSGSAKGYNYFTGKEENVSLTADDYVISAAQPQGNLLKVLFDPQPFLSDSLTYDITAWALPYAYGVQSFAVKNALQVTNAKQNAVINNTEKNVYGFILPWQGMASVKAAIALLQKGVRLRYASAGFDAGGESFTPGSIIILKTGNEKFGEGLWQMINDEANKNGVKLFVSNGGMVQRGFDFGSSAVHSIKMPKVVLLTGEGVNPNAAGEVWNYFDNEIEYPVTLMNAKSFSAGDLRNVDVLILPDGRYPFLNNKDASEGLQNWINAGGKLIALENAVSQLSRLEWSGIKAKEDKEDDKEKISTNTDLAKYADRDRHDVSSGTPGAILRVTTDNTHPMMFGYNREYYSLKMTDAVYEHLGSGWNTGTLKTKPKVAGYIGYKLLPKLNDGVLFGVQEVGNGNIVFMADDVLFRSFWQNGKLMFANSVFLVGN